MLATIAPARPATVDDRDFARIVQRDSALLRSVARRSLDGDSDVDDVVQEALVAAWTHADSIVDGDAITGWLVTTVRRRSYDRLRSPATRRRAELADELVADAQEDPAEVAHRRFLVAEALRALGAMPELQRRCWELRQLDHLSYAAIGAELMLPATTVRGLLVRARARVACELAHWR